jgi:hypothetical protein
MGGTGWSSGPDKLTVESERSICLTPRLVLDFEIEASTGLINQINSVGTEQSAISQANPNECHASLQSSSVLEEVEAARFYLSPAMGKVKQTVHPFPSSESIQIRPP